MRSIFTIILLALTSITFAEEVETLNVDIIAYSALLEEDAQALKNLKKALYENGIVGIKGIPDYATKVQTFIEAARAFSSLSDTTKEKYAPNREKGDLFVGYEAGKEKFKRPDGTWVIDDLKISYYAFVPNCNENRWPSEMDLKTPFQEIGGLMASTGRLILEKIGLTEGESAISLQNTPALGRMLHYKKSGESDKDNPFWCGAHFDHGLFTALLPAFYFQEGELVPEPSEAGLFVKTTSDGVYKKVVADDPEVLLFQVGEFSQLASDDGIRATEHRVHKAKGAIERYTLALFFDAPMDATIHSTSTLTSDERYGGPEGAPCTYRHWNDESFKRYIVKEGDSTN